MFMKLEESVGGIFHFSVGSIISNKGKNKITIYLRNGNRIVI